MNLLHVHAQKHTHTYITLVFQCWALLSEASPLANPLFEPFNGSAGGDQNLYFNDWLEVIIEFSSSSFDFADDVHSPLSENVCLTSCPDLYSVLFHPECQKSKMNKSNPKPIIHSSDYAKQNPLKNKKNKKISDFIN